MSDIFNKQYEQDTDDLSLTPQQAFAAIALITSSIDGEISQIEYDIASTYISRMQLYQDWNTDSIAQMNQEIFEMMVSGQTTIDSLVQAAASALDFNLRKVAFICAVDIAFGDGGIKDQEKDFINELLTILEIEPEEATKIIHVMRIKNSG